MPAEPERLPTEPIEMARALQLLREGTLTVHGLLPWSSNYTFAVTASDGELECLAVYKPRRGERPLWDFPRGTLCLREVAAFQVSDALGWNLVPPTVLREGPQGIGSLQFYVDVNPEEHYFTFRDECGEAARRIAAFDVVINNADRKSGHILRDSVGHAWCIDHGVSFHEEDKLRTVVWDFTGQSLPDNLRDDLGRLRKQLGGGTPLTQALSQLLSKGEMAAMRRRLDRLLHAGVYPAPSSHWPSVPWPPV